MFVTRTRGAVFTGGAALLFAFHTTGLTRQWEAGMHAAGPPPAHTGGFEEPTCLACHSEFTLNGIEGALSTTGFPDRYTPGEQYLVEVSLLGEDMKAAGFQAAFRYASGPMSGANAGRVDVLDTFVAVRRLLESGVDYVQHTEAGAQTVQSGTAHWSFVWTAPRSDETVELHIAANDANGDNSPLGDLVYAISRTAPSAVSFR